MSGLKSNEIKITEIVSVQQSNSCEYNWKVINVRTIFGHKSRIHNRFDQTSESCKAENAVDNNNNHLYLLVKFILKFTT